jgi:hypothetical protein
VTPRDSALYLLSDLSRGVVPFQDVAEIADAGRGQRLDRPRRNRIDANVLSAEIGRKIAHARLQRGFRNPHHVVMRHPFLGAIIGQRHDRAAVGQQLLGALGDRGQRVAADQHGPGKIVGGGFEIAAVELVLVGERDGVDHEVDLAPLLPEHFKHRVDGQGIGDVAMAEQDAVEFFGQRLDAFFQRVALPGQCYFRARRTAGLGDAPGDRAVVGNPEDHPALALHQT